MLADFFSGRVLIARRFVISASKTAGHMVPTRRAGATAAAAATARAGATATCEMLTLFHVRAADAHAAAISNMASAPTFSSAAAAGSFVGAVPAGLVTPEAVIVKSLR